MNELIASTVSKTPIEIALQIDEEGYTTAKALYEWLELDPSNYSRWIRQNITENLYVDENDYSSLMTSKNGRGNYAQDYRISANLAKKICMMANSDRGNQGREYFLGCEVGLKRSVEIINELQCQVKNLSDKLGNINNRLICMESGTSVAGGKLSEWVNTTSADIIGLSNYCDCSVKEMYSRVIDRMEEIYGIFFQRYFDEYAVSHQNEKPIWRITVIDYYDLNDAFETAYIQIGKEVGYEF